MTDGSLPDRTGGRLRLADLAASLATVLRTGDPGSAATDPAADPAAREVLGATLDSRRVAPGDLYAALPGARAHGADFAAQAAAAGAVAALTDPTGAERVLAAGLPALVVDDPRAVLGDLAAAIHGRPGDRLRTVGVTGTNGKTTTAYLVEAVLRHSGWCTGLLGTVETRIAGERVASVRTTPEAPDLHALLARMRDAGVRGCALEVSSHALAQHRVDGLVVDVAVFTNLSQDHLDFHPTMEDYFRAKASLFTPARARHGVVALDDDWGRRLLHEARAAGLPVTGVRTQPGAGDADWTVDVLDAGREGSTVELVPADGSSPWRLRCPMPGSFNVSNAVLAAVAGLRLGLTREQVAAGLARAEGVPGRMQLVPAPPALAGRAPVVVVDYAHSPDALTRVLTTLRAQTPGRLVVVLGAGGDRDRVKRPLMGAAAAGLADVVVVTDDNPRSEVPADIRAAVLAGARPAAGPGVRVLEVADRREAVATALAAAQGPGDTVLLAGKGHESGQETAGVTVPFDDREVAAELLRASAPSTGGAA
ncbi:UDP-N-acetylmuramoyl-L-alanyl-D-glutamate--2,6-diaminopimelate ligase [Kineococcus gynurae]|uniref:UDP-N-acetylmuramoyl-L-alanyl-D-glutamate--2,6-diaminopimelate ligase n=1 Tax=Kineococcus gynurae TaxID=452979 RepID=A0ABV5LXS3_9ACTN